MSTRQCPRHTVEMKGRYFNTRGLSELNDRQQRYCRCLNAVACKQPDECWDPFSDPTITRRRGPQTKRTKETCYSIWPVCAATVGTTLGRRSCLPYLDFSPNSKIPTGELRALALRHHDSMLQLGIQWGNIKQRSDLLDALSILQISKY